MVNDKFYTYNILIHTLLFSFIHIFIVPSEYHYYQSLIGRSGNTIYAYMLNLFKKEQA